MKQHEPKKYELTDMIIKDRDSSGRIVTVHRIRSLRNFKITKWVRHQPVVSEVRIGDYGGWVEKEDNLSHSGKAWVDETAIIFGNAKVSGDAWVGGYSLVFDHAKIKGNAKVRDSKICGHAEVRDNAIVDKAGQKIKGSTLIYGSMRISTSYLE